MATARPWYSDKNLELAWQSVQAVTDPWYKNAQDLAYTAFEWAKHSYIHLIGQQTRIAWNPSPPVRLHRAKASGLTRTVNLLDVPDQVVFQAMAREISAAAYPVLSPYYYKRVFSNLLLTPGRWDLRFFRDWRRCYSEFIGAQISALLAGGDPIKTGIQGFMYDIRTAILPFLFIFNTELLMIGVETWYHLLVTIVTAITAMMLFAAATQGFFIVRCRIWEILALLLIAFTLFRPGYWMDKIYPPLESSPASDIFEIAGGMPEDSQIRIHIVGEDLEGRIVDKTVMLPMGAKAGGEERLMEAGLELRFEDGKTFVENVVFGSTAERQKIDFDFEIVSVETKTDRPLRQLFYIPALVLLGLIIVLQRRRRETPAVAATA